MVPAPDKPNFVICCPSGEWSGYRTLAECQAQYPTLENMGRPDRYFWVQEH